MSKVNECLSVQLNTVGVERTPEIEAWLSMAERKLETELSKMIEAGVFREIVVNPMSEMFPPRPNVGDALSYALSDPDDAILYGPLGEDDVKKFLTGGFSGDLSFRSGDPDPARDAREDSHAKWLELNKEQPKKIEEKSVRELDADENTLDALSKAIDKHR